MESGHEMRSALQLVEIRFDTATFDDIERDKKIKTEAQLSLIGGTMGLLTGFSIISGVEIIFFLIRSIFQFEKHLTVLSRLFCSVRIIQNSWTKLEEGFRAFRLRVCTK